MLFRSISYHAYGSYAYQEQPDRAVLNGRALTVSSGIYNAVAITTTGEVKTWGGSEKTGNAALDQNIAETRYANGNVTVIVENEDGSTSTIHVNDRPATFESLSVGAPYTVYEPDPNDLEHMVKREGTLAFPMSVDISEYLQVSYADNSVWSVGNADDDQVIEGPTYTEGDRKSVV